MENLESLITTGKLKTYEITGGFINVFWEHADIPTGGLLLFKFTQSQEKLVDIKTVYQRYLPVKYKPRWCEIVSRTQGASFATSA